MIFCVAVGVLHQSGCQTPDYARHDSNAGDIAEKVVRYGSIGGAATGGYFLGSSMAPNNKMAWGAGAATAAGLTMWGANKLLDAVRGGSYKNGKADGVAEARAEILREKWKREAVYGFSADGDGKQQKTETKTRRVYVPARTINGVEYAGGYQSVQIVYP